MTPQTPTPTPAPTTPVEVTCLRVISPDRVYAEIIVGDRTVTGEIQKPAGISTDWAKLLMAVRGFFREGRPVMPVKFTFGQLPQVAQNMVRDRLAATSG